MEDQVQWKYLHHRRLDIQIVALPLQGHVARRVAITEDRLML